MSTRAIAPAVDKDFSTVSRDLNRPDVLHDATPEPPTPSGSTLASTEVGVSEKGTDSIRTPGWIAPAVGTSHVTVINDRKHVVSDLPPEPPAPSGSCRLHQLWV